MRRMIFCLLVGVCALVSPVNPTSLKGLKADLVSHDNVTRLEWLVDEILDELPADERNASFDNLGDYLRGLKARGGRTEWLADEAIDSL